VEVVVEDLGATSSTTCAKAITPDVYGPLLAPLYRDVLAHYGVVALSCRVRDPDRRGKVESNIGHTQSALRGHRFESLEDAQACSTTGTRGGPTHASNLVWAFPHGSSPQGASRHACRVARREPTVGDRMSDSVFE
jgi:hypothetical protein